MLISEAPGDADIEGVVLRKGALAREGGPDRDLKALGELEELFVSPRVQKSRAHQGEGPLALGDKISRAPHAFHVRARGMEVGPLARIGDIEHFGLGVLDVEGDLNHHGPRPSGAGGFIRPDEHLERRIRPVHHEGLLGDGLYDLHPLLRPVAVTLLNPAPVEPLRGTRSHEDDHGRVLVKGLGERAHDVGRARSARRAHDGDRPAAPHAEVAIGHVHGMVLASRPYALDLRL